MNNIYTNLLKKKKAKKENQVKQLKELDEVVSSYHFDHIVSQHSSEYTMVTKKIAKAEKKLTCLKLEYDKRVKLTGNEDKKANLLLGKLKNLKDVSQKIVSETSDKDKKALKLAQKILKLEKKYNKRVKKSGNTDMVAAKLYKKFNYVIEKNVYKTKVKIAHITHKIKIINDKLWWYELPQEEKKERRSDLSFYRPDVLGYVLSLFSVAAELIYMIMLLKIMDRIYWIAFVVLVNIVFLLLLFTIAIKVKNYKKKFAYWSFAFGVYCIIRISWVITGLMGVDLGSATVATQGYIYGCNAYMILASFVVGIESLIKIRRQEIFLSEKKISSIQLSK